MANRYVVFVQDKGETGRVARVIGPFPSYRKAEAFIRRDADPSTGAMWYGIRVLEPEEGGSRG